MRTLLQITLGLTVLSSAACDRSHSPTQATAGTSLSNSSLTSLRLSQGTLSPVFSSNTTGYTVPVQNDTTSITVTPTSSDPAATILVNGGVVASGTASASIGLPVGTSVIGVSVTSADASSTTTYNIAVTRLP